MNEDVEQARYYDDGQLPLFETKIRDACNDIGLNWYAALKLYEDGLLSFNPAELECINQGQETEVIFLGNLVVSGCDEMMLKQMLKNLKRPYQYRIDLIYYNWKSKKWCIFPHLDNDFRKNLVKEWLEDLDKGQFLFDWINEIEMKHIFEDWIDDLLNDGDTDQLIEIEKSCSQAIERLRVSDQS